ncbi:MAG: hypothetical protein HY548_06050 [Elusimicrobia bacterium]|nr:hypothetical protein [Elusimicrobiota bacterium]
MSAVDRPGVDGGTLLTFIAGVKPLSDSLSGSGPDSLSRACDNELRAFDPRVIL